MIPIRDNIPSRSPPMINYAILTLNVLVFLYQISAGRAGEQIIERYGMIPARITRPNEPVPVRQSMLLETPFGLQQRVGHRPAAAPPFHPYWTLLTCIALHGGWMHLIGNCWFLYIFGDNVEDRLGHGLYALFYIVSGVGASIIHWAAGPDSIVPTIGASGAIAGVMGAYFLLYPHARVLSVIPIVVFLEIIVLPAYVFLGIWFLFQFVQGSLAGTSPTGGGVAWWAHIGGFLVGGGLLLLLKYAGLLKSAPEYIHPGRRVAVYRYHIR